MIFVNDIICLIPEIYLTFSLLLVLVYCSVLQKNYNLSPSVLYIYRIVPLITLVLIFLFYLQPQIEFFYFNFLLENNGLTHFSKILICILFSLLSLSFIDYYHNESDTLGDTYEHLIIMILSILGMFILISANDFLVLFLGIELLSLGLYVLAASKKQVVSSLEAGLKYFVLGAFSSGILLLGISLIYGSLGMTNFSDIKYFFIDIFFLEKKIFNVFLVGFSFVSVGLFFKLAAAPFHSWAPDVYTGSPTFITAFFSVIPKIAIISVVIKLFFIIFFEINFYWSFFLIFCSTCSLITGCLGAIYNTNLKRLMAYGTINHLGFMLLSLSSVSVEGVQASLFYLVIYLLLNLNFLSILLAVRQIDKKRVLQNIKDLSYVLYSNPLVSIFLILNLFSMAGIPPLSGFFSKFYVLYSALNSNMIFMPLLAILISAASCFYYIRMVKSSLFETENNNTKILVLKKISIESSIVMVLTFLFNLLLFLNPDFLLSICYNVSYKLFL